MKAIGLVAIAMFATGCSWVSLTEQGQAVQIGYAGNVQECTMLGEVSAKTPSRVMLERGDATVQNELYALARNEAGTMGATNLVMHGLPSDDGRQAFSAYQCPPA